MAYRTGVSPARYDYSQRVPQGSFFSGIANALGGVVKGFVTGGPVGAITGGISAVLGSHPATAAPATAAPLTPPPPPHLAASLAPPPTLSPPKTALPGGASTGASYGQTGVTQIGIGNMNVTAGQRGYHMSKARKGKPAHLVRNRHMNWANSRALRRAERRVGAFVHHATKLIRWVHPHKAGHAVPKFHRRKRA